MMEKSCTLLVHFDKGTPSLANEIKDALEGNDVESKIEAMKKAIMLLLNGDTILHLFITTIRYVLPSEDHTVQKLLLIYLEIIDKTDSKGKVLPEMILICQNLRNNLQSPNEYLRGVTLRFLCRLNESEIMEPLIPSILANLEHRHPFVRRNAVLAVMFVYRHPQGEQLLVDAPEIIEKFLTSEQDAASKRNAFLMLFNCAQDRALSYLFTHIDSIIDWSEQLQMVVLELIKKVCRVNKGKGEKGKYIKVIIAMLNAPSSAVVYECAGTLMSFSSAPTVVRAAANTYCQLLLLQSDNNVKLIVLDRISEIKASHREIMVELVIDVLSALSSPNLDIRRKTIDIVHDLITLENVDEIVMMLKKEVVKTQSGELEKNGEYRQMLVQVIYSCEIKFPELNREVHETPRCSSCYVLKKGEKEYVNLSDGRKLCSYCYSIAIIDIEKCESLIKKVHEFYKILKFKVDESIPIFLVDKKVISKGCRPNSTTKGYVRGKTILGGTRLITRIEKCTKNGENIEVEIKSAATSGITILLLFGLPDVLMGGVLAHEMMHAYFQGVKGCRIMEEKVEEGFCEVMSYKWMEWFCSSIGAQSSYKTSNEMRADRYRKRFKDYYIQLMEMNTDKIYGQGFREVKRAVDESNLKDTLLHVVSKGSLPPHKYFLDPNPNQNPPKGKGRGKRRCKWRKGQGKRRCKWRKG